MDKGTKYIEKFIPQNINRNEKNFVEIIRNIQNMIVYFCNQN